MSVLTNYGLDRRFCIAPMLDWTDRHCRYWLRLIFPQALLYTEMITSGAVLYGDRERLLRFDPAEHPVSLQLGGSRPADMAECAAIAEALGYDEVNINVGCPSERVQSGAFGACLMAEPQTVAACVEAMRKRVEIPVTVKSRIGIDTMEGYEPLKYFVSVVAAAGCEVFIVHARKAWLKGLSPRENRELPPLHYEYVYQLKQDFPDLTIVVNGGLQNINDIVMHLQHVDGTMIGRVAYQNPYSLIGIRKAVFGEPGGVPSRADIVHSYYEYIERCLEEGIYLKHIVKHMLGLYQGVPGAKRWRRQLTEQSVSSTATLDVVRSALALVRNVEVASGSVNTIASAS